MKFVDDALKLHIAATKTLLPGTEFYIFLNPDFLLSISELYLSSIGMQDMLNGSLGKNSYIVKGTKLLETIIR